MTNYKLNLAIFQYYKINLGAMTRLLTENVTNPIILSPALMIITIILINMFITHKTVSINKEGASYTFVINKITSVFFDISSKNNELYANILDKKINLRTLQKNLQTIVKYLQNLTLENIQPFNIETTRKSFKIFIRKGYYNKLSDLFKHKRNDIIIRIDKIGINYFLVNAKSRYLPLFYVMAIYYFKRDEVILREIKRIRQKEVTIKDRVERIKFILLIFLDKIQTLTELGFKYNKNSKVIIKQLLRKITDPEFIGFLQCRVWFNNVTQLEYKVKSIKTSKNKIITTKNDRNFISTRETVNIF